MRVVKMNGMDLNLFQFDYDLTWAGFFMNKHGHIYARYGTRKGKQPEEMMSKAGLMTVMRKVLEVHKTEGDRKPAAAMAPRPPETFKSLPGPIRSGRECLHCHQVWEFMRKDLGNAAKQYYEIEAKEFYPLPENLGIALDADRGNAVASVDPKSAAGKAAIEAGDEIVSMNGTPTYSAADMSWVLHRLAKGGSLKVEVLRGGEKKEIKVAPTGAWRTRDSSWRGSVSYFGRPAPG